MRRRDISSVLLGSAAGAALLATGNSQAQSCNPPCHARTQGEINAGITPTSLEYEPGDVRRYGGDPTGAADSTAAFNNALTGNTSCTAVDGIYRIDGTITINASQSVRLAKNAQLIRKSAASSNTAPVVHIKGNFALLEGGSVASENNSPNGVVCCGHLNTSSSNWNSLYWEFRNCRVYAKDFGGAGASPYPGDGDGIGVYIPSSQPALGSAATNYFGTLDNVKIENATVAFMLTDLANGHTFVNCGFRGIYWYGFRLHGAYGNSFHGGFLEIGHRNGIIAIWLAPKLAPSAPHASSLESVRNHFQGFTMEFAGTTDIGAHFGVTCTNNFLQFAWNSNGTTFNDVSRANTLITDTKGAVFNTLCVNAATPTGTGTQISFGNTTATSVGTAGGAAALPATPLGYLVVDYGGTKVKVPYYRN